MINWKLRIKNKTTLAAIIGAIVSCIYTVLSALGITPSIDKSSVLTIINILITVLVALGIVIDPTTEGISDSARAMKYDIPGENLDSYEEREDERGETDAARVHEPENKPNEKA